MEETNSNESVATKPWWLRQNSHVAFEMPTLVAANIRECYLLRFVNKFPSFLGFFDMQESASPEFHVVKTQHEMMPNRKRDVSMVVGRTIETLVSHPI